MHNQPIFLIGFMASGKSTAAKLVAEHFKRPWRDSDKEIEEFTQLKITDFFNEKGESEFREMEKKWLLNSIFTNEIVSLGGGLPCYNQLMVELHKKGIIIFIDTEWETIEKRLKLDNIRPLNKSINEVKQLYLDRLSCYKKANYSVKSSEELIDILQKIFEN